MAKAFIKNFSNFKGLDYRMSDLAGDPGLAFDSKNTRIRKPFAIGKRKGKKIFAQPKPHFGKATYSWNDPDTGQTEQELIAINRHLWRLVPRVFYITPVGVSAQVSLLVNDATSTFRMVVTLDGVIATFGGHPYIDLGTGYGASDLTIEGLKILLDAHASIACTYDNRIVANGAQANKGSIAAPLTVFTGHGLTKGHAYELKYTQQGEGDPRVITKTTATTIAWSHGDTISVAANEVLGVGAYPAALLPIFISDAFAIDPLQIIYYVWEPIPYNGYALQDNPGENFGPFNGFFEDRNARDFEHATFVNAENILYIGTGYNNIAKYDGQSVYSAGMPSMFPTKPTLATAFSGSLEGTYQYIHTFVHTDVRGRIIEGKPSGFSDPITIAAGGSVNLTLPAIVDFASTSSDQIRFSILTGIVNGIQSSATLAITGDVGAGHSLHPFRVGDILYFGAGGNYETREVTGVTDTTVTLDSTISVADDTLITANLRVAIYRTVADVFTDYFLVAEVPVTELTNGFEDTVADSDLGRQYLFPVDPEATADVVPQASKLAIHQGLLVAAGGKSHDVRNKFEDFYSTGFPAATRQPQTFYWSDVDAGIEAFPVRNQDRLPAHIDGGITAVGSDTDDMLAIFKERAYYSINGDLGSLQYSIIEQALGNFGVGSQQSLDKVVINNGAGSLSALMGMGRFGPIAISGGQIIKGLTQQIGAKFIDDVDYTADEIYRFKRCVGINDYLTQTYVCYAPLEVNAVYPEVVGTREVFNSESFALDLEFLLWQRWDSKDNEVATQADFNDDNGFNPAGGFAIYNNNFFESAMFTHEASGELTSILMKRHNFEIPGEEQYDYADNTFPIEWAFIPSWDDGGEPSIDKEWQIFKLYAFQALKPATNPPFYTAQIPFTIQVQTFLDFDDPLIAEIDTEYNLDFRTPGKRTELFPLKGTKAKAMMFRMLESAIHEAAYVSGYEYSIDAGYLRDRIKE